MITGRGIITGRNWGKTPHDPITLGTSGDTLLGLSSSQVLSLDTQAANFLFSGPVSGAVATPTFRALVDADFPATLNPILAGVTLQYGTGVSTLLQTDSTGDLIITPTGTGIGCAKRMRLGNYESWGSNKEILQIYHTYDSADLASYPNALEVHSYWTDTVDAVGGTLRAAFGGVFANSPNTIAGIQGFSYSAYASAAATITGSAIGISGSAVLQVAGASCPLLIGLDGGAYPAATSVATKIIGVRGRVLVSTGGVVTEDAIGVNSGNINGAGTIANFYGFKLETLPATPTITNAYGLYLPAITQGTTLNYAIYSAGGLVHIENLTASLSVVTNATKELASLAYTGATSFRKNLGLETDDSPTFVGLTLSGLTASLPVVTDGSKSLTSQSIANFIEAIGLGPTDSPTFAGITIGDTGAVGRLPSGPRVIFTDSGATVKLSGCDVGIESGKTFTFRSDGSLGAYAIGYKAVASRFPLRFMGSSDSGTQRYFEFGYYTDDNPDDTWYAGVSINSYTGDIYTTGVLKVDAVQVISNQGAHVADATDAATVITQLNVLLTRLEAHGLLAST